MKTVQLKANLKSAIQTVRVSFSREQVLDQHQHFDFCQYQDYWNWRTTMSDDTRDLPWRLRTKWLDPVRFWIWYAEQIGRRIACDLTDHKWVDTSEAGPDSGDMSGYCTRCGYSFHHQLY